MAGSSLRVAVIGAGPSGIFTAEQLVDQTAVPVTVDLIDRLPTPFGLVRYGIAPDHLKMRALRDTLDHERVRFVGNVDVGEDIDLAELRRHVDAVVYTYGAAGDRRLGIEGEGLSGSLAATEVVSWYNGHPDADVSGVEAAVARARDVVVVGVGNVALDVARMLSRSAGELEHTETPQHVLDCLAAAPVERVTVLGRRGPAQAAFTTQELRELALLGAATVGVDQDMLRAEPEPTDRAAARNLAAMRLWAENSPMVGKVQLSLRFYARPRRLLGTDRVTGVEIEHTALDADGRVVGTGRLEVVPADLVVRSVGYRGSPLPGLPVDERSGTVAHQAGRVFRAGAPSPGEYVAGWIKRGPTGVVGTNRSDARETVTSLLADVAAGTIAAAGRTDDLVDTLAARGVDAVLFTQWRQIDAAERALGLRRGRARTTMHDRADLLAAARADAAAVTGAGALHLRHR